jgi:MFS family permease
MGKNATAFTSAGQGRLHYGWIIAATGVLVLFSCLGLARFSFGVLLPPMSEALGLTYSQRGALGTGYFIGYLVTVLAAPKAAARFGYRATITFGLALIAATLGALGATGGFATALVLYSITGVGSGAANIPLMALISFWFAPSVRGTATGLVIGGNGLGIIFSGLLVPVVADVAGASGWRWAWIMLAAVSGLVAILAGVLLRDDPNAKGLAMIGNQGRSKPPPSSAQGFSGREKGVLTHLGAIYFLFGATYMVYGTFVVTTMIEELGMDAGAAGRFWAAVGFFGMFSGALFGRFSDAFSRRSGLMGAYVMQTIAYVLAGLAASKLPLYLSVGLYGLSVFSVPTIMAATVADRLGPARAAMGFAIITLFFAAGQVVGPIGAGRIADMTGGFSLGYLIAAGLTAFAVVLSLFVTPVRNSS